MNILSRITVPAKLDHLGDLMATVLSAAREAGFDDVKLGHLELAAEEAVVNVCNYAYPDGNGEIEVKCMSDNEYFRVEIVNSGVPFDVTSVPEPDTAAELMDRQAGGLGVFFMKKLMDEVTYRREDAKNVLTLVLKRSNG